MITAFWSWFQEYEAEIRRDLDTKNLESFIIQELGSRVIAFSPFLGFELLRDDSKKKSKYYLSICCNGNRDYFMLVKTLVAHAPKIPEWKIRSFIRAKGNPEELLKEEVDFGSFVIIPNTIQFAIEYYDQEDGVFGLVCLLPLRLHQMDEERLKEHLYFLIQDLWGEKFLGKRINEVRAIYHRQDKYDFQEFENLPSVLESMRAAMENE